MSNIIPFDVAQRWAANEKRAEQQRREVEEVGNHAWGRLQKARKLNKKDRIEIAKAMHVMLEELKQKKPKLRLGKLAMEADLAKDLNSKELHRLTLPPGKDPVKRGLRADAKKYVNLLKAIQRHTGENRMQLVEQLTWATSFHPKHTPGTEESERMADYLQEAINLIDLEFKEASGGDSLFDTFTKTARIKINMAKQADRLKLERPRWPYYDVGADYYDIEDSHPELGAVELIPAVSSNFLPRSEDDFDPQYAYWQRDFWYANKYSQLTARYTYSSNVTHHDALMHLPRVCLGVVESNSYFTTTVDEEKALREYSETHTVFQFEVEPSPHQREIERLKSCVGELGEIRDPETGHAHIAHRHPKTGEWVKGLCGKVGHKYYCVDGTSHVWLVIYPSPDNRALIPVLYQSMDEGGTLLMPLTQRSLISLKDRIFVDAGEPRNLYDRITELMRASSDRVIYKSWQETAKDVLSNPILLANRKRLAEEEDFERGITEIWDSK